MSQAFKTFLVYLAKNAVNAALLALAPVYQDPVSYSLHTKAGLLHVGELVGYAVLIREGIIVVPKLLKWSTTNGATLFFMKTIITTITVLFLCVSLFAQSTTTTTAFSTTTASFGLTPITLPSFGQTLAGMESDTGFNLTTNNQFGLTTIISNATYIGPRYSRFFPAISKYIQNHTALNGGNFQVGFTFSGGATKATKNQWGGDGGFVVNYAPNGSNSWGLAFQVGAAYLPGIVNADSGHAKFIPKFAVGPNFHF